MEKLGIEPIALVTQAFNFVVMVAVLTYLLYKPILKMLKTRRDKIAEGLVYAEKMKHEVEKTEVARQKIIQEAREEARTVIEEARKAGKLVETDIIEKAHEDAQSIVVKGKSDIEMARADMEKKLKEQMIELASAIARKVLESTLSVKNHREIFDKKIRAIAKQLS